jgi:hypothetical protein
MVTTGLREGLEAPLERDQVVQNGGALCSIQV